MSLCAKVKKILIRGRKAGVLPVYKMMEARLVKK